MDVVSTSHSPSVQDLADKLNETALQSITIFLDNLPQDELSVDDIGVKGTPDSSRSVQTDDGSCVGEAVYNFDTSSGATTPSTVGHSPPVSPRDTAGQFSTAVIDNGCATTATTQDTAVSINFDEMSSQNDADGFVIVNCDTGAPTASAAPPECVTQRQELMSNISELFSTEYRLVGIQDIVQTRSGDKRTAVMPKLGETYSLSGSDRATAPGPLQRLGGVFAVLNYIDVTYGSNTASCIGCSDQVFRGRLAVYMQHLCSNSENQSISIDVQPMCKKCATSYLEKEQCAAAPLRTISYSFALSRMTLHLRMLLESRLTTRSPHLRPHTMEGLLKRCIQCGHDINTEKDTDFRPLIMRRGKSVELGFAVVCSGECEKKFRALQTAIATVPQGYSPVVKLGKATFSSRHSRSWALLSDSETRSVLSPNNNKLPTGTIMHRCANPACTYCAMVRAVVETDTERAARKARSATAVAASVSTDNDKKPVGSVESVQQNYEWLLYIVERLKEANVYEDVLLSDKDSACLVCRQATTNLCKTCGAAHICSGPRRTCAYQLAYTQVHKRNCPPFGKAWSVVFRC